MTAAIAGLGIILQPTFIVHRTLADGRLQEILSDFETDELGIYTVYPDNRLLSARVRTFIDHLADCYGKEAWDTSVGPLTR